MKATEKVKLKFFKGLLSQSQACARITLKELIKAIGETEKEALECYTGPTDLVKILVINAWLLPG